MPGSSGANPRSISLAPGAEIGPSLRLTKKLSGGAMGSVWIAEHLGLRVNVAVKVLSHALAREPGMVDRFKREATAAAKIKSPHVVQMLDHGVTSEGMPFIAMELLVGEDLSARIARLGPLPLAEVVDLVTQVSRALMQAHRIGILHRDLKPENVFISESGNERFVKVLDFGVARADRKRDFALSSSGNLIGAALAMSPEELLGAKEADPSSDVWALACLAYRALTGSPPFSGKNFAALCVAVDTGEFPMPSTIKADLPPAIDDFFRTALSREPSRRFASARAMADAFARAAGMESPFLASSSGDSAAFTPIDLQTFAQATNPPRSPLRSKKAVLAMCALAGAALSVVVQLAFRAKPPADPRSAGSQLDLGPSGSRQTESSAGLAPSGSRQTESSAGLAPSGSRQTDPSPAIAPSGSASADPSPEIAPSAPPPPPRPRVPHKKDRGF